jgi:hypothetical protein
MELIMSDIVEEEAKPEARAVTTVYVNAKPVELTSHEQTGMSIKTAAIAHGVEIREDFILFEEGPHDKAKHIEDEQEVLVSNGDRFLADVDISTIKVNDHAVRVEGKRQTGASIKAAAIAQGVPIKSDFVLLQELPHQRTKEIKDTESVRVNDDSQFQAIPNDDHS